MVENQMNIDRKSFTFISFVILWHYFFSSSFVLRLNPKLFWPAIFVIAVISLLKGNGLLQGEEIKLYIFLGLGLVTCFFSADAWTSISNDMYFFIYLGVAAMVARNLSEEKIVKMVLFFCIIHLVCIYIQVILPDIYKNYILSLLPTYAHADILYQMTYNASFYGFTVQTSMSAMYMTIGAICSATIAKYESSNWSKIFHVVLVFLFITGVLFTTRRGSILALCLVLAYIYFDTSGSKLAKLLLIVTGVFFLLSFGIDKIPGMQGLLDKFERLSGNMMNGRQNIWGNALKNFWNNPLFGYGVGMASEAGGGSLVDNAYLAVLVERGGIGTVIWFAPVIWIFLRTFRKKFISKNEKNFGRDFSLYIQLLFIIMSFMENYFGQALAMFIYYLAILNADFADMRRSIYEYELD